MNLHEILLASKMSGKSTGNADLSDYYTKSQTDSLINGKVDKVTGKGLSTNDFTTELKNKLTGLENYDDTAIKSQNALNYGTLGYQRKNMLKLTVPPSTRNGVSFSVGDDGTITLNGTASANADVYFPEYPYSVSVADTWLYIDKKSIISCYGTMGWFSIAYYKPNVTEYVHANLNFKTIPNNSPLILEAGSILTSIFIAIKSGVNYTDKTLSVMLRYAEITDNTYEPYKPSIAEYIASLEARITALESTPVSSLNTAGINTAEEEIS